MKVDFELIDSILKDHSYDATQVIGIMQDIQKEYRYLPEEGLKYAAEKIGIAGGNAKTAITMILADCGLEEARERLARAKGHVREAIK